MAQDWNYDEGTRAALEKFIADRKLTHAQIAGKLRISPTRVTKYLNLNQPGRTPEADMPKVEKAAKNHLRHNARRSRLRESLFENSVTTGADAVLRTIRSSGDVGVIHSAGGVGKTSSGELYAADNQNTLFVTVRQYACGSRAVEEMIFREYLTYSGSKWPGNIKPSLWLETELSGSEWFIIIDNAQRLHISGFKWVMDMHDATHIPFAFLGNTEILKTLRANDPEGQLITRIGIVSTVQLSDDAEATAQKLIDQFAPKSSSLLDAAVDVLAATGNSRSLKKQLTLAAVIYEGARTKDWEKCFAAAGTQLIKPTNVSLRRRED